MIQTEQLTNYNYTINFTGCGPKLYDFDKDNIDNAIKNDIMLLLGKHVNQLECLITHESVEDARYDEPIEMLVISLYVVFSININEYELTNSLLILGDYLERSFIENIED